jgi:DNA primase small subunit
MAESSLELNFLREKFKHYYVEASKRFKPPPAMENREFGFIPFSPRKSMIRHKGFKTVDQLTIFLSNFAPSDVYYSSAYYSNPDVEDMKKKGWLGADLIFDIDSDHLNTACKVSHDRWKCLGCGFEGVGMEPENCPKCGGKRIEAEKHVCDECLKAARNETLKLTSILEEDFGFPPRLIKIVFSGHRGYHVHVEDSSVRELGSEERKEIVDYVLGFGLNLKILYPELGQRHISKIDPSAEGWRGRIAKAVYTLFLKDENELRRMGLKEKTIKIIVENRDHLTEKIYLEPESGRRFPGSFWKDVVKASVCLEAAAVDTVVTTDIHRLIRLPQTLHGKTGFKVVEIPLDELSGFNPFRDALAFSEDEKVKVKIVKSKSFKLGEEEYCLKAGEVRVVPLPAAIFLIGTGLGTISKAT